tara:strand:+ start:150 stop:437 length:288 start_codon:yes stop_codon:yes gene_type:complete
VTLSVVEIGESNTGAGDDAFEGDKTGGSKEKVCDVEEGRGEPRDVGCGLTGMCPCEDVIDRDASMFPNVAAIAQVPPKIIGPDRLCTYYPNEQNQ